MPNKYNTKQSQRHKYYLGILKNCIKYYQRMIQLSYYQNCNTLLLNFQGLFYVSPQKKAYATVMIKKRARF